MFIFVSEHVVLSAVVVGVHFSGGVGVDVECGVVVIVHVHKC